jgi:ureidoglycolate hydrolase
MLHKQIKDPIDRHPIDRIVVSQSFVNFSGRKWEVVVADDLQNAEAVSGHAKITGL